MPLPATTVSLKVSVIFESKATPVALSAGEVEVSVGGDKSAAVKLRTEELPIPAYELPLASVIAVASTSI